MGGMRRKEPTRVAAHLFSRTRGVVVHSWGKCRIGGEGSGEEYRHPALILKGLSIETCLIVPLTTSTKDHPLRVAVGLIGGKKARALLSQMRVIDTKRLVRKIEYLDVNTFEQIRKAARGMLPERAAPTNSGEGWPAPAGRRVRPIVTRLSAGPQG